MILRKLYLLHNFIWWSKFILKWHCEMTIVFLTNLYIYIYIYKISLIIVQMCLMLCITQFKWTRIMTVPASPFFTDKKIYIYKINCLLFWTKLLIFIYFKVIILLCNINILLLLFGLLGKRINCLARQGWFEVGRREVLPLKNDHLDYAATGSGGWDQLSVGFTTG